MSTNDTSNKLSNVVKHAHHWKERYITIDGVDCFSGLECQKCKLFLSPDALVDLVNFHSACPLIPVLAIPLGPSEHK